MRELVRELINHGMDELTIQSVIMFLETEENFKRMTKWLKAVKNPTKNDIMVKAWMIDEGYENTD